MSEDQVFGDKQKEQKGAEDKAKRLRDRELGDIRKVLDTPEGRRVMWRIMAAAGTFRSPYVPGYPDDTSINLGKQMMGLWLYSEIEAADFGGFLKAQREYMAERERSKNKTGG